MNSVISDSFSWSRCFGIARLYKRAIKKQIIIYISLIIAFYLLTVLVLSVGSGLNTIGIYGVISSIMTMMLYITPVVFTGRDNTLMAQVPVTPLEKTVFYLLYCEIVFAVLGFGLWYLFSWIGGFVFEIGNVNSYVQQFAITDAGMNFYSAGFISLSILCSLMQGTLITFTGLYVVFKAKRHVIVKCILVPVIYILALGTISGFLGVVIGLRGALDQAASGSIDEDLIVNDFISYMMPVVAGITIVQIIGTIIVVRMLYKWFRHPRIA